MKKSTDIERKEAKRKYDLKRNKDPKIKAIRKKCSKEWFKKHWKDPKFRARVRKHNRDYIKDPEARVAKNKNTRRWCRKRLKDPKYRAAQNKKSVERSRRIYKNPKIRAAINKRNRLEKQKMPGRYGAMLHRYRKLRKRGAKGKPLTVEQHRKKLYYPDGTKKRCYYCGHDISIGGSGLDRKDNSLNYTNENTIPCCRGCNGWKNYLHTFEETMIHFKPMRDAARELK